MDASNLAPIGEIKPDKQTRVNYFIIDVCTTAVIAKFFTPRSKKLMQVLALMVFVGVLWLTEAIQV